MSATTDVTTIVFMNPDSGEIYPLSTEALTRAQKPKSRLNKEYVGTLLLHRSGDVTRIEQIVVLGPHGTGFGSRLLSSLTSTWSIEVKTSAPLKMSLDELKGTVLRCLEKSRKAEVLYLEEPGDVREVLNSVKNATSAAELCDVMKLPEPQDSLDVL